MIINTLFPDFPPDPNQPRMASRCIPAPSGTGPEGEFCRTCKFLAHVRHHDKTYLKCRVVQKFWTHGAGSDIRAMWDACREWQPKEDEEGWLSKQ